jgi:hypothetical protein
MKLVVFLYVINIHPVYAVVVWVSNSPPCGTNLYGVKRLYIKDMQQYTQFY